jgi:leucyl-tRNA synthetase
VDPGVIIDRFGADAARWFVLSDNPPERDVEWTETGAQGAFRFVQRLYRIAKTFENQTMGEAPAEFTKEAKELRRLTHRTIAAVTEALETFAFNLAVARIYELSGALLRTSRNDEKTLLWATLEGIDVLSRLIAPLTPHIAEEVFLTVFGGGQLVAQMPWPAAEPGLLVEEQITIAVQVNGKLRGTITVPTGAAREPTLAIAKEAVAGALKDVSVVKEIFVPDRIVNFVVK